jgi:outer membrane lipoprotein-sorting protein
MLTISISNAAETISAAFQLTEHRDETSHLSSGFIYYSPEKALAAHVISPLEQWMIFRGDTLSIFYPNENKLIKIPSRGGEVTLPIFQLIINTSLEDLGLVAAGYTLNDTRLENDKITAIWKPPSTAEKILGDLIATYMHDSLMSIVAYNPKEKIVSQQIYSDYLISEGMLFPGHLEVTTYGETDSVFEAIVLKDVAINAEIPDDMLNPIIPDNVEATTIEW